MISQRVRGFYNLFVLAQLVLVVAFYWVHFLVIKTFYSEVAAPEPYLIYCVLIVLGLLVDAFQRHDRDDNWLQKSAVHKHRVALRQTLYAGIAIVLYLAATKDVIISRMFLFTLLPLLHLLLFLSAWLLPPKLAHHLFQVRRAERTLLIGPSQKVVALQFWLERKANYGINTVGVICDETGDVAGGYPILGSTSNWEQVAKQKQVTQILLLDTTPLSPWLRDVANICEQLGIRLLVLTDLPERFGHAITYMEDDGLQFFALRAEPLENPVNRGLKRLVDIAIALPVVIFILPVASAVVWLFQRCQSPGPLFYHQPRAGFQSSAFQIVKFRTMRADNLEVTRQAVRNDERVFPAGRWLRRLSIDELPQFWNVLRGEMSVVGPRPHLAEHNEQFARVLRNYYVRGFVKPGITGLAQVRGYRGDARDEEKLRKRIESDIDYLENWSLSMDSMIIIRTAWQMVAPPETAF
jgi:exopolysaccharide biosynthesis polyprenyl glycosylphosphotransferase